MWKKEDIRHYMVWFCYWSSVECKKELQEDFFSPFCYYVSFIKTWQANDKLWVHGIFFAFLKVEKVCKMHLSDSNGRGMVDCMHNVVLVTTKHVVQKVIFFYLIVMKSQLSISKARFQSMIVWLKIEGGCFYSWICKRSLKEVS